MDIEGAGLDTGAFLFGRLTLPGIWEHQTMIHDMIDAFLLTALFMLVFALIDQVRERKEKASLPGVNGLRSARCKSLHA